MASALIGAVVVVPRGDHHEATHTRAAHDACHRVSVEGGLALEHVSVGLRDRHISTEVGAKGSVDSQAVSRVVTDEGGDLFGLVEVFWGVDHDIILGVVVVLGVDGGVVDEGAGEVGLTSLIIKVCDAEPVADHRRPITAGDVDDDTRLAHVLSDLMPE